MKIRPVGAEVVPSGRTDRQTHVNRIDTTFNKINHNHVLNLFKPRGFFTYRQV